MTPRPFSPQAGLEFIRDRLRQRARAEADDPPAAQEPQTPQRELPRQPPQTVASRIRDLSFLSIPAGGGAAGKPGCRQRVAEAAAVEPPVAAVPSDDVALQAASQQQKDSPRLEAVGSVDELNSLLGMALAQGLCPRLTTELPLIQRELIQVASNLAFSEEEGRRYNVRKIQASQVARLEELTNEFGQAAAPLGNFIVPGGTPGAAGLHVARAVSMRVGRAVMALSRQEPVGDLVLPYLCRLTHLLFAMARYENRCRNVPETVVAGSSGAAEGRPGGCC